LIGHVVPTSEKASEKTWRLSPMRSVQHLDSPTVIYFDTSVLNII
jgi:hypothetical protein